MGRGELPKKRSREQKAEKRQVSSQQPRICGPSYHQGHHRLHQPGAGAGRAGSLEAPASPHPPAQHTSLPHLARPFPTTYVQ
jgi:hypothetical protein